MNKQVLQNIFLRKNQCSTIATVNKLILNFVCTKYKVQNKLQKNLNEGKLAHFKIRTVSSYENNVR